MPSDTGGRSLREAVGVLDDAEALEQTIDELEEHGFDRAEISLLASEDTIREKLGHLYTRVEDVEDDPTIPRTFYVANESVGGAEGGLIGGLMYVGFCAAAGVAVAAGGALAGILGAAAIGGGAGGLIGSALAALVDKHHADYLQEQLDRGGLILWVDTRDAEHEERAREILTKHSAHDVHIHDIKK